MEIYFLSNECWFIYNLTAFILFSFIYYVKKWLSRNSTADDEKNLLGIFNIVKYLNNGYLRSTRYLEVPAFQRQITFV